MMLLPNLLSLSVERSKVSLLETKRIDNQLTRKLLKVQNLHLPLHSVAQTKKEKKRTVSTPSRRTVIRPPED